VIEALEIDFMEGRLLPRPRRSGRLVEGRLGRPVSAETGPLPSPQLVARHARGEAALGDRAQAGVGQAGQAERIAMTGFAEEGSQLEP
jgi:hypothetical protein